MSTLQALRNKKKLLDAGQVVIKVFNVWIPLVDLNGELLKKVNELGPLKAEELIRELKAILDA